MTKDFQVSPRTRPSKDAARITQSPAAHLQTLQRGDEVVPFPGDPHVFVQQAGRASRPRFQATGSVDAVLPADDQRRFMVFETPAPSRAQRMAEIHEELAAIAQAEERALRDHLAALLENAKTVASTTGIRAGVREEARGLALELERRLASLDRVMRTAQ